MLLPGRPVLRLGVALWRTVLGSGESGVSWPFLLYSLDVSLQLVVGEGAFANGAWVRGVGCHVAKNGKVKPHEVVWTRGTFEEGRKVYNEKSSNKEEELRRTRAMASTDSRKRKGGVGKEPATKREKRECARYKELSKDENKRFVMLTLAKCGHLACLNRAVSDGYTEWMLATKGLENLWGTPSANFEKRLSVMWEIAQGAGKEAEQRFRMVAFTSARFLLTTDNDGSWFAFFCKEKMYEGTGLEDQIVSSIKKDYFMRSLSFKGGNKLDIIKECVARFKPTDLSRSVAVLQCAERRDIESARAVELTTWSNQAWPVGPMMDLVLKLIKSGGYQFLDLLEKAGFSIESVIAEDRDGETLKQAVIYGEHGIARHLVFRGMKHTNLLLFGRWINVKPVCPIARSWFWGRTSGETDDWYKTMSVNRGICFDMVVNDFEIPINLYCTRDEFADFPAK